MSKKRLKKLLCFVMLTIIVAGSTLGQSIKNEDYIFNYGHLWNTLYQIKKEKKLTVAFLGGSITHMYGWRNLVCDRHEQQFPETEFRFINAGIPSLGSLPHAFRLRTDVLDKGKIDLLFVESAVNDHVNGTPEKIQIRALEGIIRQALTDNPYMDIIMMAFVDPDKITDYRNHKVPDEINVHKKIAQKYCLPFINLAKEITDRIDNGEFTWEKDFKDLHPSPFGQKLYYQSIWVLLEKYFDKIGIPKIHQLPEPIDPMNYNHGHYKNIQEDIELSGFTIQEDWIPDDSLATREGFIHIPVLEALTPGNSFKLKFKGSMIGIGVLSGDDTGILEYTIDGKVYPRMDLFTPWSKSLYLPWFRILANDLKATGHFLEVKVSNLHNKESRGHAIRIVVFLEN